MTGDEVPLEDHAFGVELQLNELVEQRERAEVQGDADRAAAIDAEIGELQDDLVATAEHIAEPGHVEPDIEPPRPDPTFDEL